MIAIIIIQALVLVVCFILIKVIWIRWRRERIQLLWLESKTYELMHIFAPDCEYNPNRSWTWYKGETNSKMGWLGPRWIPNEEEKKKINRKFTPNELRDMYYFAAAEEESLLEQNLIKKDN